MMIHRAGKNLSYKLIFICLMFVCGQAKAQKIIIANLKDSIASAKTEIKRIDFMNQLAWQYYQTDDSGTLIFAEQIIKKSQKIGYKEGYYAAINIIGNVWLRKNEYSKAMRMYLEILTYRKQQNNQQALGAVLNNIALVYNGQQDYYMSLKYLRMVLDIDKQTGDLPSLAKTYSNIGLQNKSTNQPDSAMYYTRLAHYISKRTNDLYDLALIKTNLSDIHYDHGNYDSSKIYAYDGLTYSLKIDDQEGIVMCKSNLAKLYIKNNQIDSAYYFAKSALKLGLLNNFKETNIEIYQSLFQIYQTRKDYKKAFEAISSYISLKDSVFNTQNTKLISSLRTDYEIEQRQTQINLLNKDKKLQQTAKSQQQILLYSALLGFVLVLIIVFVLIRNNKLQQKANTLLSDKNIEINLQKTQIEAQRDNLVEMNEEINQQQEEILAQNEALNEKTNLVEEKNRNVMASIAYAKRIQSALLPLPEYIEQYLPDHFIIYEPRDVVSGDFYWFKEKNGKLIVAAVDCTGHGVPGAFMSMIAGALLTQIVLDYGITQPDQILNQLHLSINKSLQQQLNSNRDGLDIALCVIDKAENTLSFAGAQNPLIYVQNGQLFQIKGERISVGGHDLLENRPVFTNHTLKIEPNTNFYIFSDGYCDQFGGPNSRKFMIKRLKELLVCIASQPFIEQKQILEQSMKNWMGAERQIDDILLIGFTV